IAAVPQQLASRLKATTVHLNTCVDTVSATTVEVNGVTMQFDRVVLAVPQHVAHQVLPSMAGTHKPVERLTSTVVFTTSSPPYHQGRLLLNEEWGEPGNDVLHVHLPTNLHPHPGGEHWVVATIVGGAATSPDVESVRRELRTWFGETVNEWGHLATTTVRHALPQIDPNHHERFLPEIEIEGVLLVGDHRAHPSVQGTLRSAERILEHLKIPIPRRNPT
ncbi:MAG TPA: FAD-dependent oxidoreductase, partial [Candidatus Poseidonia sp.]|nr:FAD-dependent oxidoreductase [Poseidonia sp.]